jgi:hypothetical protein
MPSKSKHKRGKHRPQSKKGKSRQRFVASTAKSPAVVESHEPVSTPATPAPRVSEPSLSSKPTIIEYPYIATELRTIGILAGIMLIVLIVLFFVLS